MISLVTDVPRPFRDASSLNSDVKAFGVLPGGFSSGRSSPSGHSSVAFTAASSDA